MHVIHVKRALDLILILLLMSLQGGQSSQGSLTENGQIVHKAWQRLIYHEIYHIYHKYVRYPKTSAFPFQLMPETLSFLRILTNFVTGCHVTHQFSRRLGKVSTKRLTCATTQKPLMLKSNCAPKEHNTHTHTHMRTAARGRYLASGSSISTCVNVPPLTRPSRFINRQKAKTATVERVPAARWERWSWRGQRKHRTNRRWTDWRRRWRLKRPPLPRSPPRKAVPAWAGWAASSRRSTGMKWGSCST